MNNAHETEESQRAVHDSLEDWLAVATAGLCEEVRQGISERLRAEGEGRDDAVTALGDPQAANRRYRRRYLTDWEKALLFPNKEGSFSTLPPLPFMFKTCALVFFIGLPLSMLGFIMGTIVGQDLWIGLFTAIMTGGLPVILVLGWPIVVAEARLCLRTQRCIAAIDSMFLAIALPLVIVLDVLTTHSLLMLPLVFAWQPFYHEIRWKIAVLLVFLFLVFAILSWLVMGYAAVSLVLMVLDYLVALIIFVWIGLASRTWLKLSIFGMPQPMRISSEHPDVEMVAHQ